MQDKSPMNPVDTRSFMRISSYSIKKLQKVKGLTRYSKLRLKSLQSKIKDLKSPSLKAKDKQELMFEISNEIEHSENSKDVIRQDYLSFFSSFVSNFKKQFPESFSVTNPSALLLDEYRKTFDFVQKLEDRQGVQKWKVFNRNTREDSMLYIYNLPEGIPTDRLLENYSSWRSMDHGNILKLKEVYLNKRTYGVETEYTGGNVLSKVPLPMKPDEALFVAYQVSSGLAYAHSMNIFHLALSPENIVVSGSGTIKIRGWNFAPFVKNANGKPVQGVDAAFMAPELSGDAKADPSAASDVYSLCMITASLVSKDVNFNPATIDDLPLKSEAAKSLLKKGLSSNPQERISAEELHSELARILKLTKEKEEKAAGVLGENVTKIDVISDGNDVAEFSTDKKDGVTRIEINLKGTRPAPESIEEESAARKAALKAIAKELKRYLNSGKYESILLLLKKREKEITEAYPDLAESIGVAKSNLSAVIKFPTVPRDEVNSRLQDLINYLNPEE